MNASTAGDDEVCTSAHKVLSDDDLLSKILAVLLLSSLRLSKSVCKRWSYLVTDQYFNWFRSRSPTADHPCGLFLRLKQPPPFIFAYLPLRTSPPPSPLIRTTSSPLYQTKSTCIELVQSCNGLLLCKDWPDKFYVYNPTINHCKLLPLPRTWKTTGFLIHMALGFDPTLSPHYKVVYPSSEPGALVHVEIYSSETGNWEVL
ncbi:hypothetical protein R6Q59_002769 [Mikania micrantha]